MKLQTYFDKDVIGIRDVESDETESFPLDLVQQIDIGISSGQPQGTIKFCITAEFNYAELELDKLGTEEFILTMASALDGFDYAFAREQTAASFENGISSTIYQSPHYPDTGIFPQI